MEENPKQDGLLDSIGEEEPLRKGKIIMVLRQFRHGVPLRVCSPVSRSVGLSFKR